METKTKAAILTVIIVVFLLVVVVYKIKSNRKRRSQSIPSADLNKNINVSGSVMQDKKPNLWGIPSWGLALLTMLLAFIVLMVVGDIIAAVFNIPESNVAALIFYILYNLIIAGGCFYIVRLDPKSIWYVPVLCNIVGIISSIIEPNFWISSLWIVICSGWVLSIIASILGAQARRKTVTSDEKLPD